MITAMNPCILSAFFLLLATVFTYANPIYVDVDATGINDGSSWTDAYPDLQEALDAAQSGDTVWIAEGAYFPTTDGNRFISFSIPDNVALYGGFEGVEATLDERNWEANTVILSGDIGVLGSTADNSYRVVSLTNVDNITIDGLSIQHGNNNFNSSIIENRSGGGLFASNSSFSLYRIRFENNIARFGGAVGIFNDSGGTFESCIFENNRSNGAGDRCGGAVNTESTQEVVHYYNCRFINNGVNFIGGAGGACSGGENTFVNCVFSQNEAPLGMALAFMNATIYQSTFWRQKGNNGLFSDGDYSLYNSIMWNNESSTIVLGGNGTFEDCLLGILECPTGSTCSGNMIYNTPPYFLHPFGGDFRLSLCSPAIDLGNNDNIPDNLLTDAAGLDRIIGGVVDMGAHEMLDLNPDFRPTDVMNTDSTYANRSWLGALLCANEHPGADTIRFLLGDGSHVIQPLYESPCLIDDSTSIDATVGYDLGEIVIDGSQYAYTDFQVTCAVGEGVRVIGDHFEMYGLEVRGFPRSGVVLSGAEQATIGLPGKGNIIWNNGLTGIISPPNISIRGQYNTVQSNYIGTTPNGDAPLDAFTSGILISEGAKNILIGGKKSLNEGNIIGNCSNGVSLQFSNNGTLSHENIKVSANHFGLDPNTNNICPNIDAFGSVVAGGSFYKNISFGGTLDEGNVVAYSSDDALIILGTGTEVAINRNTFICNRVGIDLEGFTSGNSGNYGIQPPQVLEADIFHLAGTAGPGDTVEIYISEIQDCPDSAACNQGRFYFGERIADATGDWEMLAADFPFPLLGGEQITTTRTNSIPVTSAFSPCVEVVCPESFATYTTTLCPSDSIVINGTTYDINNPSGTEIFIDASTIGCDSIVTINIDFLPESVGNFDTTICESISLEIGGIIFNIDNPGGTAVLESGAVNGCDSLVMVNLQFEPNAQTSLNEVICNGDTLIYNGDMLTTAGVYTYIFPAANTCDSIVSLQIEVLNTVSESLQASLCSGDTLIFNGQVLTAEGSYAATFTAANGCDSTIVLDLELLPNVESTLNASFCLGESYTFCGETYNQAGTYECLLTASTGCDSTVFLQLEELLETEGQFDTTLCEGEELLLEGFLFDEAGDYEVVLTNQQGCDSIVQVSLFYQSIDLPPGTTEPDQGFQDGRITIELGDEPLEVLWEDGSSALTLENLKSGNYSVVFTDSLGCMYTAVYVVEEGELYVDIPNVFTPNGDGENDYFQVLSNALEELEIRRFDVYNRWGQQVYNNDTPSTGWDGRYNNQDQPTEVYYYLIEVGTSGSGEVIQQLKGNVSLVR
jgi:gliding motility-associated-like protein